MCNVEQPHQGIERIVPDTMAPMRNSHPHEQAVHPKPDLDFRKHLLAEQERLLSSIGRSRTAGNDITVEQTEDECDLARISHERELFFSLHESETALLRAVQTALESLDGGTFGECVECEERIGQKRLEAIPWATLCINCQEAEEMARLAANSRFVGMDGDEPE